MADHFKNKYLKSDIFRISYLKKKSILFFTFSLDEEIELESSYQTVNGLLNI